MPISSYTPVGWSSSTPLNPTNLQKMDNQIKNITDDLVNDAPVQHDKGTKTMMIESASTGTQVVSNGAFVGVDILWSTAFVEAPTVAGGLYGSSNLAHVTWKYENVTTTGCKVWIYNNSGAQINVILSLLAFGTKSL